MKLNLVISAVIAGSLILGVVGGSLLSQRYALGGDHGKLIIDRLTGKVSHINKGVIEEIPTEAQLRKAREAELRKESKEREARLRKEREERKARITEFNAVKANPSSAQFNKQYHNPETGEWLLREYMSVAKGSNETHKTLSIFEYNDRAGVLHISMWDSKEEKWTELEEVSQEEIDRINERAAAGS